MGLFAVLVLGLGLFITDKDRRITVGMKVVLL